MFLKPRILISCADFQMIKKAKDREKRGTMKFTTSFKKTTKSPSKILKFAQQVPVSFLSSIFDADSDRSYITGVAGDLLPLGSIVISACFISEIRGTCGPF